MSKKMIGCLIILTALWATVGCAKQEMICCEYINETEGFSLSINRPAGWTVRICEGWPATETQEASPDEGIMLYADDAQENWIYLCSRIAPFYMDDYDDIQTIKVNDELNALHGIKIEGERVREAYVFEGDFAGYYDVQIEMWEKDYKKYKKVISQVVASCHIEAPGREE